MSRVLPAYRPATRLIATATTRPPHIGRKIGVSSRQKNSADEVPHRPVRVLEEVLQLLAADVDAEERERALEDDVRHHDGADQLPQPRAGCRRRLRER